jgi:hypothetical protein
LSAFKSLNAVAEGTMYSWRFPSLSVVVALMMLGGCATRPINPPMEQVDLTKGYRFDTRWERRRN